MSKLYSEKDIISKIEDVFQFDNLFNLIKEREVLKNELFHPEFVKILEKDMHRWYSVAEAGRIVGVEKPIPPSSLKHYIDNLEEYIIPDDAPSTKYVRLNYIALIKLRMIWLLKDELKITGLKIEVGILGSIVNNKNEISVDTSINRELQQYYTMTEVLFRAFMETGEDGRPRFKSHVHTLLNSNNLLERQSNLVNDLEEQKQIIESLTKENQEMQVRVKKYEALTSALEEKLNAIPRTIEQSKEEVKKTIDEEQRKKIQDSERKLSSLTETLRARSQAEKEWDQKGALARAFGKRNEYVERRIKEILDKQNDTE